MCPKNGTGVLKGPKLLTYHHPTHLCPPPPTYLIDLVHYVKGRHVLPVPLDDIDELVDGAVLPQDHVAAVQPVLSQHRLNRVVRQLRLLSARTGRKGNKIYI